MNERLVLFPFETRVSPRGRLVIGGCDTNDLALQYGTPLYLFDEQTLRRKCRDFKEAFGSLYPGTRILYASKAFLNRALAGLLREEGMGLDVVSGGEIGLARAAAFPLEKAYFHGNNKSAEELKLALEYGVGRIVVDNFDELALLNDLAAPAGRQPEIILRLSPGIDPHTHQYIATGAIDSKFGFPIFQWDEAVMQALAANHLNLLGFHFHIGSLIYETKPFEDAMDAVLRFAAQAKTKYGFNLRELNVGGGYAIQYTVDTPAPPIGFYAAAIATNLKQQCAVLGLDLPQLVVESGRAIVGQAGVALYRVGAVKDIPGVRRYVSLDGGMADNIRPAIYGSRYEAVLASDMTRPGAATVTLAGKFCESGDILIRDIALPPLRRDDLIAIPGSGAYCLAMGSNYNLSFKPAVVMVNQGQARLIRRRETVADLMRCDIE
jgi:diaminopimelate decarboxylase